MTATATPKKAATARAYAIRQRRARVWMRRLLLWVGLPTLLAVLHYGFIASNVFESTAIVAARATTKEECAKKAALVKDVLLSRTEILSVAEKLNLSEEYRRGDILARLSANAGKEETYQYLRDHISLSDASAACTMTVRVRAFNPVLSRDIAANLIVATNTRLYALENQDHLPDTGALVFVSGPSLPDSAALPRRLWGVITVMVVALVAVGVVSLFAGAVREHAKL